MLVVINQGTSLYDFDQIQMDFSLTEKCGQQNYFKDYSTSAQEIPRSNFLLFVFSFLCLKQKISSFQYLIFQFEKSYHTLYDIHIVVG